MNRWCEPLILPCLWKERLLSWSRAWATKAKRAAADSKWRVSSLSSGPKNFLPRKRLACGHVWTKRVALSCNGPFGRAAECRRSAAMPAVTISWYCRQVVKESMRHAGAPGHQSVWAGSRLFSTSSRQKLKRYRRRSRMEVKLSASKKR